MSTQDRKTSVDDVLRSIRHMVANEKAVGGGRADSAPAPDAAPTPEPAVAADPAPTVKDAPSEAAAVTVSEPVADDLPEPEEQPLVLTTDMRVPEPLAPEVPEDALRAGIAAYLGSEEGRALIADVLRTELTQGETGQNMSRNIIALVERTVDGAKSPSQ